MDAQTQNNSPSQEYLSEDLLPPIWNIREDRNERFIGREEELGRLRDQLLQEGIAFLGEPQPTVGGMGKTQLAREYAYRFAEEYQVVWWVHAQERGVLQFSFAQLMTALNLLAGEADRKRHTVKEARSYLSTHAGWLLIVDGLEDLTALEEILPASGAGHVIVTTLLGAAHLPQLPITLSALDEEESAGYLHDRLPDEGVDGIGEITRQVCSSPLLLEVLSKFIAASNMDVQSALDKLKEVAPPPLRGNTSVETYKGTLRTLVGIILDRLQMVHPAARDLARLCSFLGPCDIPVFLLLHDEAGVSDRLSKALSNSDAFENCLETLLDYGLIERHETSISMHEIIQEAIRETLSQEPLKAWSGAAVRVIAGAFPYQAEYKLPVPECSRLLSHALAATQYAEEIGVSREKTATLLYQVGLYLHERGTLEEAKTCYLLSISISHKVYGATHPNFATRINSLGVVEHELGNLMEAQGML